MFLQALSSGVTLIADTANVGLGIRIDFGYKASNKFGVAVVWSAGATGTPISDFNRVKAVADANGDTITTVMMDDFAFNNMLKSTELKQSYAGSLGIAISSGSIIPTPNLAQVNSFLLGQYGWTIKLVNRTVKTENWLGKIGAFLADFFLNKGFGITSFIFIRIVFLIGAYLILDMAFS